MANKYRSDASASIHEMMSDFHETGVISMTTMREFDELCLEPIKPFSAAEIKRIRERSQTSQAVFALHLNVSASLVSKWEQGTKSPSGPALALLNIVKNKGLSALR